MKIFRSQKEKHQVGLPPGTLVYTGKKEHDAVQIRVISYDAIDYFEQEIGIDELPSIMEGRKKVLWVDIVGLQDEEFLEKLSTEYGFHRLSMEDVVNVRQRPKLEVFDDYLLAVVKMINFDRSQAEPEEEQISFIMKDDTLFTFQERRGDVFQFVRNRIIESRGNIRKRKTDYLFYALLDAVVDHYFLVMEVIGERLEDLESKTIESPDKAIMNQLYQQRRQLMDLRRSVYPLREVVSGMEKFAEAFISKDVRPFVRDLYENVIQVIETLEVFRDMASGVLDLYMNSLSNRMNNVMKVLTIISTIFIPLSFVAGVYGMNFDNMPELHSQNGYFFVLGGMGSAALLMLFFFYRKKWI